VLGVLFNCKLAYLCPDQVSFERKAMVKKGNAVKGILAVIWVYNYDLFFLNW
jgi:hypothetical protein